MSKLRGLVSVLMVVLILVVGSVVTTGCSRAKYGSTMAPSATTTITVRTLLYDDQGTPIAGVSVLRNGIVQGQTDQTGHAVVTVPVDQEVTIGVAGDAYVPLLSPVAGIVHGPSETWTFYLSRQ